MPRDGSDVYTQPFPDVVEGTTIESAVYNGFVADVAHRPQRAAADRVRRYRRKQRQLTRASIWRPKRRRRSSPIMTVISGMPGQFSFGDERDRATGCRSCVRRRLLHR